MPGPLTTPLPRSPAWPGHWLATWSRGIIGRRAQYADLRGQLGFGRRERLLAAGAAPAGGYALAASDRALYYRGGGAAWTRLGWEQVTRVSWEPAGRRLVVIGLADAGVATTERTRAVVPLRERGHLPEVAMERITHTRLGSWRVVLADRRPLVVVARRRPASDELLWFVFCAEGNLDLSDGAQRAEVERAIARLAAESGLTPRPAAVRPAGDHPSRIPL
jgi:hypothetical protein